MKAVVFCLMLSASLLAGETGAEENRRIESRFIAPCCWHENLSVHDSPVARDLRAEVAAMAAQGRTEEEIVSRFVARYGERILAEPRGKSFWVLTATPVALLLAALMMLAAWLRKRSGGIRPISTDVDSLPEFEIE